MNVTDGDRERAREIVTALNPEHAYVDEFVYDGDVQPLREAIAAALAENINWREWGIGSRIRRAAEETTE